VSPHEFDFALTLSDEAPSARPLNTDAMLAELITSVLAYVGYAPDTVAELTAALRGALAAGAAQGSRQANLAFRAHDGELAITIAYDAGAEWRTTRPLP
jgi:hypothetical protein